MERDNVTRYDKFVGFFRPTYLRKRIEYVKDQMKKEEENGRKHTLSEMEKRLGITKWVHDGLPSQGYRSGFPKS